MSWWGSFESKICFSVDSIGTAGIAAKLVVGRLLGSLMVVVQVCSKNASTVSAILACNTLQCKEITFTPSNEENFRKVVLNNLMFKPKHYRLKNF